VYHAGQPRYVGKRIGAFRQQAVKKENARRGVVLRGPKLEVKGNSLRTLVNALVRNGHKEYDVLWVYSCEKVKRYYEDIMEQDAIRFYNEGIRDYHMGLLRTQVGSKADGTKLSKQFKKYIDGIDPHKSERKKKGKHKPLDNLLKNVSAIPVVVETVKKADTTNKKESDS
jgi:hypothetical protein